MGDDWFVPIAGAAALVVALVLAAGSVLVIRDTVRRRGRWGLNLKPVRCPECGEPAPMIRKPKNRRQALWGGCTCEACGLEYDKWGRPVGDESGS